MVFKKVYGFWKKSMVSGKSQWFLENDFGFWKMSVVTGNLVYGVQKYYLWFKKTCLWFHAKLPFASYKIVSGVWKNNLWFQDKLSLVFRTQCFKVLDKMF